MGVKTEVVLEAGKERIFQKWGVKEVVTTALMSVLAILLMFLGAMLTLFNTRFSMVASGGLGMFLAAPVFMLMVLRVNRCGIMTVFTTLASLVFCTMGNYIYMIPFYIAGGLIIDLIFFKSERQRQNVWWITGAWSLFSGLYLLSTLVPFIFDIQSYIDDVVANRGVGQDYIDAFFCFYTDPMWIAGIAAATVVLGFLGCLVGKMLMRKHFARAGAL